MAAVLLIVGLALHLTIRDGWQPAAFAFYALPATVLAIAATSACVASRFAKPWLAVALGVATWAATQTIAWNADAPADDRAAFRIAVWNTFHDTMAGADSFRVSRGIAAADADLALLIECGLGHDDGHNRYSLDGWSRRTGQRPIYLRNRFLALADVDAFPSDRPMPRHLPPGSEAAGLRRLTDLALTTPGANRVLRLSLPDAGGGQRKATVLLVHPPSTPTWDRTEVFARLADEIETLAAAGPLIVLGDFNLPAGSVHFDRIRRTLRSVTEEAPGVRYLPTWPMPCPVLTLDQMWVSEEFLLHACQTPYAIASDHEAVVVTLTLRPADDANE